jgi:hypothetical protein
VGFYHGLDGRCFDVFVFAHVCMCVEIGEAQFLRLTYVLRL